MQTIKKMNTSSEFEHTGWVSRFIIRKNAVQSLTVAATSEPALSQKSIQLLQ